MSSTSGVLRGAQRPRVELVPAFAWSEADDAAFLASSYGLTPDDWQHHVLESWLARNAGDKWAAGQCGLAVPRQNGKNGVIEVRELYGMVALGERFLHTAHEVKTARKAFIRLKGFFGEKADDPGAPFPELNRLVREVRSTNGQEAIVLHTQACRALGGGSCDCRGGASIEFVARSRGSGRGFTVDVLVLDEAQELTDEQLEALLPTISSAPSGNPQRILTGTPPSETAQGLVFTRMRESGVKGESARMAWHEWSLAGDFDIFDPQNWAATNPALGIRLQRTVIEDELPPGMSPAGFARERCGRWNETTDGVVGPFPAGAWESTLDGVSSIADVARFYVGVDVSADRSATHIVVAARDADGAPHVELSASLAGCDSVAAWLAERKARIVEVVGQGKGAPVSAVLDDIEAEGVPVRRWQGAELTAWCGQFYDLVKSGRLRRPAQPLLDRAAAQAVMKPLGDSWAWNRRGSPVDVGPLVAATAAVGALLHQREQRRSAYEDAELVIA